jgi:hypothetical protein
VSGQHSGPAHEGNSRTMGMHADEKSDGCIVPVKPRTMPSDIGGGDGGGTAAGQGEGELRCMLRTQRRNRHVTEAASPRIGAAWLPNTPKADHVRPETGAGWGKAACPDLRGGRGAILAPRRQQLGVQTIGPGQYRWARLGVQWRNSGHLPAVVLCATLVLPCLTSAQRNSAAPDASALARLDAKQGCEAARGVPRAVRSSARVASPVRLLNVTQGQRYDDET